MKENAIYIPDLNICIKDFYVKNGKVHFIGFDNNISVSSVSLQNIHSNYIYESNNNICYINKNNYIPNLGIYDYQFNFLMGLTAILIAFSFLIGLVIVGATRWFMMF